MSIEIFQIGSQAKFVQNSKVKGTFDRSQVQAIYNEASNKVSFIINNIGTLNTADISAGNELFITTDTGGLVDVTNQGAFDDNWKLLFPNEGGGSGTTPNLQQVCNVGNETNTEIISYSNAGSGSAAAISAFGAIDVDSRFIQIASDDGSDSGYLRYRNKAGKQTTIFQPTAGGDNDVFIWPDKEGSSDVIAMVSDLPLTQDFIPNASNLVNIDSVTDTRPTIQVIEAKAPGANTSSITVTLRAVVDVIAANANTSFQFDLPIIAGAPDRMIGTGTAYRAGNDIAPIAVTSLTNGNLAVVNFKSTAAGSTEIFITLSYN